MLFIHNLITKHYFKSLVLALLASLVGTCRCIQDGVADVHRLIWILQHDRYTRHIPKDVSIAV